VASALHVDASSLEVPVDPPPPAGDIKADVERFTTLDACVAERAKLDPVVGDALRAIGYETFLRDACRVLEATKKKDAGVCKAIDASSLRAHCEASLAMYAADADACPWEVPSRPQYGRDAMCVAVSLRDARFCAGVERARRATCLALARRDPKQCEAGVTSSERAACARELARWRGALDANGKGVAEGDALTKPEGKLSVHGVEGSPEPTQPEVDIADDVSRGIVLFEQRDGLRFDVGMLREAGLTTFAPTPVAHPYVGFTLFAPAGKEGKEVRTDAKVERAELGVPGTATLITPGARSMLHATIEKLDPKRGGQVKVILDGQLGDAPRGYKLHAEITTFVRDVVKRGTMFPTGSTRADGG
jgi:hypothetical protein